MKHLLSILLLASCAACQGPAGYTVGNQSGTDAGMDINAATCPTNNVWYNGGNVIANPKVHLVFWGDWWRAGTGELSYLYFSEAWTKLSNDPNFYFRLAEYGVGIGSMVGSFLNYSTMPIGNLLESDAQRELQSEIQSGALPANDTGSIYVIMLPPGVPSQYDLSENFSGHHANVNGVVYALIDYNKNSNYVNTIVSHEIYESSTDPFSNGYVGSSGETEIGDFCEDYTYSLDGYTIQTLWSQSQCVCVPVIPDGGN